MEIQPTEIQPLEIRLLGPLEVTDGGQVATLGPPRRRAVLAMLALAAPAVVSTDRLVDGLWGEDLPQSPLATLQVFVHGLRKALRTVCDDELVLRAPPGYRLAVAPEQVDAHVFTTLGATAHRLRAAGDLEAARVALDDALALWRGPALADVRSAPFAEPEAVRLDGARLQVQEDLFDLRLALGEHAVLIEPLSRAVDEHPMRERFWGQLMTALYRSDRQGEALSAYARARDHLAEELGVDPGQALRHLELAILRQDPELSAPAPVGSVSVAVAPRPAGRVPRPVTPTFGREDLVAEVRRLVADPAVRALTLTGPGGSGKSRVATLTALDLPQATFLAATERTTVEQLTREITLALTGADDASMLSGLGAEALVVLDNLEAVADGADVVRDLVERTTVVTVLATSRVPLRIRAERTVDVPPLPEPAAVAMFLDRARAVDPGFREEDHREDVADLCRFLDGLPLAIELAAAQVPVLSPARIRAALETDLSLLSARAVDIPERQQTLEATLAWSYDRLAPGARSVLDRLALFERGFTLEAAEAVSDDVPNVLAALAELVEVRLVWPREGRVEVRFVVSGTVRSFARTRLRSRGDLATRWQAHAHHLLDRARALREGLDGPEGAAVVGRFDDTAADLDAAIDWALDAGSHGLALDLVVACTDLWVASGRLSDGLRRAQRVAAIGGWTAPERAAAHVAVGTLAYHLTDWDLAASECRAALAIDDAPRAVAAAARCHLAGVLMVTGSSEEGTTLARRALEDAEAEGVHSITVVSLSMLAIGCAIAGDTDGERELHERRLELVSARGDVARLADTLNTLAEIALDEADAATARTYAGESIAIAGSAFPLEARDATITLARAAAVDGDAAAAATHLTDAWRLADRTGQSLALAQCLRVGGCLAVLLDEPGTAVRAFAAAHRLRPSPSGTEEPIEADLAGRLAEARADLGGTRSAQEWLLGSRLPLDSVRAQVAALLTVPALAEPASTS